MKAVRYLPAAQRALRKHRNVATRIMKIDELAARPDAFANLVMPLKGRPERRLRVGDYRVLFIVEGDELLVIDIGPRGDIYD